MLHCVSICLLSSSRLDGISLFRSTMAFQSNTLVNGQWTTRTVDVNTVMQHFDQREKANAAPQMATERTPKFGILTQTVIRSPLAHWILPVRLRDSKLHDVAFVGVRRINFYVYSLCLFPPFSIPITTLFMSLCTLYFEPMC